MPAATNTLGDMVSRVILELGIPSKITEVKLAITNAIYAYQNDHFFFNEATTSFNTVANQEYYGTADGVPSTLLKILALSMRQGTSPLSSPTVATMQEVDSIQAGLVTGLPFAYCYWDSQIRFYPIPDAVYTCKIVYIRSFTPPSLETSNGVWVTHGEGEKLIRAAAKRIFIQDNLEFFDPNKLAILMANEKAAYRELVGDTNDLKGTPRLRPSPYGV